MDVLIGALIGKSILVLMYFLFVLFVAIFAKTKGRSFILFFLLSIILSPLIGFIIALIVKNEKKAQKKHEEMLNAIKTSNEHNNSQESSSTENVIDLQSIEDYAENKGMQILQKINETTYRIGHPNSPIEEMAVLINNTWQTK